MFKPLKYRKIDNEYWTIETPGNTGFWSIQKLDTWYVVEYSEFHVLINQKSFKTKQSAKNYVRKRYLETAGSRSQIARNWKIGDPMPNEKSLQEWVKREGFSKPQLFSYMDLQVLFWKYVICKL